MLRIEGLSVSYGEGLAVRDVALAVPPGAAACLMGRNGVGKTTLLKSVMGFLAPRVGEVFVEGRPINVLATDERARLGIGYVPQGREIFPDLSVLENLYIGLLARGQPTAIPDEIFSLFPALRTMLRRKGGDLSGGQKNHILL